MADPVYGTCPLCGGEPIGGLPPLGGADAVRDENQKQYLRKFQGRWLCDRCIENEKSDVQSRRESEKCSKSEKNRNRMGFE